MSSIRPVLVKGLTLVSALMYVPSPVHAILLSHQSCSFDVISTAADRGNAQDSDFVPIEPTQVTFDIPEGVADQALVVQFAADANVAKQAEIRLGYSIDGGPTQFFGPGNLANTAEFFETRSNLSVIPLSAFGSPGRHTLQPTWRISGAAGTAGFMAGRCLTVEGPIQQASASPIPPPPPPLPVQKGVVLAIDATCGGGFRIVNVGRDGTNFRWTATVIRNTTLESLGGDEGTGFIRGAEETDPEFPSVDIVDVEFPADIPERCSEGPFEERGCFVINSVVSVSPDGRPDGRGSASARADGCF